MLLSIALGLFILSFIVLILVVVNLFKSMGDMHCKILKLDIKITACLDEQRNRNNRIIEGYSDE